MSDIFSSQKRSEIMSKISGKETKPEILVRKFLFAQGIRYRKNDKRYPGKPDILIPKYKIAIFVHGCFWHGHTCKAGKLPNTRREFWEHKINNTKKRDSQRSNELSELGFKVLVVWQCELKNHTARSERLSRLFKEIKVAFLLLFIPSFFIWV